MNLTSVPIPLCGHSEAYFEVKLYSLKRRAGVQGFIDAENMKERVTEKVS